jgi:tetratricopeptide (TPR) repeat protein
MKGPIKAILKYILPIALIILLFSANHTAGVALLLIYLAYTLYTGWASICTFIGGLRYSRGLTEEALKWFKRGYDTNRAHSRSVISYAYLLLKTGHTDEAGLVLDKLLEKKPKREEELYAKSNLALVYWKKGDLDSAVSTLQEVIQEYRTSAIYGSLGYLLILKGDLEKALEFNLEAYDYNSENTVILDNLGQTYYMKGIYDKALEIYKTLIAKNPGFPEAYYNYALLLLKLDQKEKAVEMLKKALDSKFSLLSDITKDMVAAKLNEVESAIHK